MAIRSKALHFTFLDLQNAIAIRAVNPEIIPGRLSSAGSDADRSAHIPR
jgi:hypothetical protein